MDETPNNYRVSANIDGSVYVSAEIDKNEAELDAMPLYRCSECQGYLNCYCEIISPGLKWRCVLCSKINSVVDPFIYKENAYRQAERIVDYNRKIFDEPALTKDCYELEAPDNFNLKTTEPPALIFMIDVSSEAKRVNLLESVLNSIKESLKECSRTMIYDSRCRVAFFFFAEHVYVFNSDSTISCVAGPMPIMLKDEMSLNLYEDMDQFYNNMEGIIEYFSKIESPGNNILAGVTLASTAFRSGTILTFLASMPNSGISALKQKNTLIVNNEYAKAAAVISNKQISLSLYMCTRVSLEYGQMRVLTQGGGMVYHYANYDGADPTYVEKLHSDLHGQLTGKQSYGALMRIRCSENVSVKRVFGNCVERSNSLYAYPNFSSAHSISFEVTMAENTKEEAYAQMAMIRVNQSGIKTIKVLTICCTADYFATQQSAIGLLQSALEREFAKVGSGRPFLDQKLRSIFSNNQTSIDKTSLAMYFSSHYKNLVLDKSIASDFRAYYFYLFMNGTIDMIYAMSYPTLINIVDTVDRLPLSQSSIQSTNAYIMDCGINLYLYIGHEFDTSQLFSDEVTSGVSLFDSFAKTEMGNYLGELIAYFTADRKIKPRYILVLESENTSYSEIFRKHMYDDAMKGIPGAMELYNSNIN